MPVQMEAIPDCNNSQAIFHVKEIGLPLRSGC
jgi:hypothetical protein